MEVLNEEAFDQCLVFLEGVENRLEFLGFEGRTRQLRELAQGDDGEFLDQFSDVLLSEFGTVDAIKAAGEDALLQVVNLRVAQAIRSWAADQKN